MISTLYDQQKYLVNFSLDILNTTFKILIIKLRHYRLKPIICGYYYFGLKYLTTSSKVSKNKTKKATKRNIANSIITINNTINNLIKDISNFICWLCDKTLLLENLNQTLFYLYILYLQNNHQSYSCIVDIYYCIFH